MFKAPVILFTSTFVLSSFSLARPIEGPYFSTTKPSDSKLQEVKSSDEVGEITNSRIDQVSLAAPIYEVENKFQLLGSVHYINQSFNSNDTTYEYQTVSVSPILLVGKKLFMARSWFHPSSKYKSAFSLLYGQPVDIHLFDFLGYESSSAFMLGRVFKYPERLEPLLMLRTTLKDSDGSFMEIFFGTRGPSKLVKGKYTGDVLYSYGYKASEIRGQTADSSLWSFNSEIDFYGSYAKKIKGILFWSVEAGVNLSLKKIQNEDGSNLIETKSELGPYLKLGINTFIDSKESEK